MKSGELIRETFGKGWAWLSVGTLCVACIGALLTQLSGRAGIAQLFGVPIVPTIGVAEKFLALPLANPQYLYLAAANIGAVIMPWMVFYQQSAVLDKGLDLSDLEVARIDTAVGAVVAQLIMAAVLIATGAVLSSGGAGTTLDDVPQIAEALTLALGGFDRSLSIVGLVCLGCGIADCRHQRVRSVPCGNETSRSKSR